MMKYYTFVVILVIFLILPVVDAKTSKSDPLTSPQKNNINKAVKKFERQVSTFEGNEGIQAYEKAVKTSISSAGLKGMDISEAAFLVMMMATKDMDDDIKMIMAEIKAMTAAKQKMRELIKDLNKWISEEMMQGSSSNDDNLKATPPGSSGNRVQYSEPIPIPDISDSDLVAQESSTRYYGIKYCKAPKINPFVPKHMPPHKSLKRDVKKYKAKLKELEKCNESMKQNLKKLKIKRKKFKKLLSSYK